MPTFHLSIMEVFWSYLGSSYPPSSSLAIIPYFASYGETTFSFVPRHFNSSVSHHPCLVSASACNSS